MDRVALTHTSFEDFVSSNKFAVVHFWASWNGYDTKMMQFLESEAPADLRRVIAIGTLDTGPEAHWELLRNHGVRGLPFLEFYRDGSLFTSRTGFDKEKVLQDLAQIVARR